MVVAIHRLDAELRPQEFCNRLLGLDHILGFDRRRPEIVSTKVVEVKGVSEFAYSRVLEPILHENMITGKQFAPLRNLAFVLASLVAGSGREGLDARDACRTRLLMEEAFLVF